MLHSEYKPFISKLRLSELGSKKDEILKTPASGRGRAKTAEKKAKSTIYMHKVASAAQTISNKSPSHLAKTCSKTKLTKKGQTPDSKATPK